MVRIPRSEPQLQPQIAMQPQATGSGWGAPGQAMQGLGRAIASLGDAFADVGSQEQDFNDKLAMVNWSNQVDMDELTSQQNYGGDGTDYTLGRQSYYESSAADLLSSVSPQNQQKAQLFVAQKRGGFLEGAQRFEGERRQGALTSTIEDSIGLQYGNAALADPGNRPRALMEATQGVNAMIDSSPLPESRKEALRARAAEFAEDMINESLAEDPDAALKALPRVQQYIDELSADEPMPIDGGRINAVNDGAEGVDGAPGAQSGRGLPPPSRLGAPGTEQPAGQGSVADRQPQASNFRILDTEAPTHAERNRIFKQGGVVVNLDTNWAKGDKPTTPMVVIPDNATKAQRQAAEAYAGKMAGLYREKFGVDLKPKVVTRSANGRGRPATIHTEPYAVTDSKAVAYFQTPEGAGAHAQILRDTFGKVPGVVFSIPHDPTRKGDHGAEANGVNEVSLAKLVLAQLKGGDARPAPTQFAGMSRVGAAPAGMVGPGAPTNAARGQNKIPTGAQSGQPQSAQGSQESGAPSYSGIPDPHGSFKIPEGSSSVRVADASGRFVPQAQPTQPPREMPTSSVKSHLRDRLLKKLPAYQRQFEAGVGLAIKSVEEAAAKGYALPPEQFDVINKSVTATGKADLRIRLDKAVAGLEATQELMHRSPVAVEQIGMSMRARLVKDGVLTATPDQIGRVEGVEALAKTMRKELDENPIGWGVHVGIIPEATPITPETLSVDLLEQRAASGRAVANYYDQPPKFFLPEERGVLKGYLDKGGPGMVRLLAGMNTAFGGDMPWAMREISKDTPEAATLGWLISTGGNPQTIADAADAIALRTTPDGEKIFKTLMPSQDQAREAAVSTTANAFRGLPGAEQRAIELANLLYVVRAQGKGLSGKPDSWDSALWLQGFNEVLGQTTDARTGITYGGLADQGGSFSSWRGIPGNYGVKVILPANVRNDALPELIDAIRITDLVQGGMPEGSPRLGLTMSAKEKQAVSRAADIAKQTGTADVSQLVPLSTRGAPIDNMGRLINVGTLRRATLVSVGDGRYWMALGDPMGDDPQWIGSNDTADGRYVLDLKALEPVLKERVPSAYKDGGGGFTGQRFSDGTWQRGIDTLKPIQAMNPDYKPGKRESSNVVDKRSEPAVSPPQEGFLSGAVRSFKKGWNQGEWNNMDPKERAAIESAVMRELQGQARQSLKGTPKSKPSKRGGRRSGRQGTGGFRPQNHIR